MAELSDLARLHDEDFYSWTQQQAERLRRTAELRPNLPEALDWVNIAEELEDLGRERLNELYSRYVVLLLHLLKWRYQPERRGPSWRMTIIGQRSRLARLIRNNPGLKSKRAQEREEAYDEALKLIPVETGLPRALFPDSCPFTLEQVEDPDFWPDAAELSEPRIPEEPGKR